MAFSTAFGRPRSGVYAAGIGLLHAALWTGTVVACCQNSGSLGNGLGAAGMGRGGAIVTSGGVIDAVEGNPAGLAGVSGATLDVSAVGLAALGSFEDRVNRDARLRGVAGASAMGAFAMPVGRTPWVISAGFTPEILLRANWHYVDPPGTAGVSYGYQRQETQIIAFRASCSLARTFGQRWAGGVSTGLVYNQNDLHAPYIFQEQPQLAGLKVLLGLTTRGYGWNGGAGLAWQPTTRLRTGLAWKSGTTINTEGTATGTASALFRAPGISADPAFRYHVQVENHLPQALSAGLSWKMQRRATWFFEGDLTGWHKAFHELPISLSGGTNATINSLAGSDALHDGVPLRWHNQGSAHGGLEVTAGERWTLRGGYSYQTDPVPTATLIPLTAAIMQQAVAGGAGWQHGRWRYDAAYQAQLPSVRRVGQSGLLAGEYDNSRIGLWIQSVTVSTQVRF